MSDFDVNIMTFGFALALHFGYLISRSTTAATLNSNIYTLTLHCQLYTCCITITITQPQRVHWLGNTLVTVCFTALQLLSIHLLFRLRGPQCLISGYSQLHKMLRPGGAARSYAALIQVRNYEIACHV